MTDWPIVGERVSDGQPISTLDQRCRKAMFLRQALELSIAGTTGLRPSAAPDSVGRS